eukprot:scaffold16174_cov37-Phaeocystis_antarctica.AAC.1
MLAPVPAPADVPVEAEATELSFERPGQPTEMVALLAHRGAVVAEGVAVDAATEACLAMCDDKESALHVHTDKLESEAVQAEEERQQLEGCNEKMQQAGLDTNQAGLDAKLSTANSGLEKLQRERVECGEALA